MYLDFSITLVIAIVYIVIMLMMQTNQIKVSQNKLHSTQTIYWSVMHLILIGLLLLHLGRGIRRNQQSIIPEAVMLALSLIVGVGVTVGLIMQMDWALSPFWGLFSALASIIMLVVHVRRKYPDPYEDALKSRREGASEGASIGTNLQEMFRANLRGSVERYIAYALEYVKLNPLYTQDGVTEKLKEANRSINMFVSNNPGKARHANELANVLSESLGDFRQLRADQVKLQKRQQKLDHDTIDRLYQQYMDRLQEGLKEL